MAENTILGRIQLKYDTLANWNSSSLVLKRGEIAIAEVASGASNSGLTPPAIGIKVGDGSSTFANLPWIQAAAGDVYDWAKAVNQFATTLNVSDSAVAHQVVTAVSESAGKISVTRRALTADDITDGTLEVARGGTGLNNIPANEVIVGNGTNTPTTKAISSSVGNNDNLVTGSAVQAYVTSQMAGLSGAMHYIGETSDIITDGLKNTYICNHRSAEEKICKVC